MRQLGAVTSSVITNKSATKYKSAVIPQEAEHLQLERAGNLRSKKPQDSAKV